MKLIHLSSLFILSFAFVSCKEESIQQSQFKNTNLPKDFSVNITKNQNGLILMATPISDITADGVKICVGSSGYCNKQSDRWITLSTAKLQNQKNAYLAKIPMKNIQQTNIYIYANKLKTNANDATKSLSRMLTINLNTNNAIQPQQNSNNANQPSTNLGNNSNTSAATDMPPLAIRAESMLGKSIGSGDCYAFVSGLTNGKIGSPIGSDPSLVTSNTILKMINYSVRSERGNSYSTFQHYAYVSHVTADRIAHIYHQNSSGRKYVAKGWMDLKTFRGSMIIHKPAT